MGLAWAQKRAREAHPFYKLTEQRSQEEVPGTGEQPGFIRGFPGGVAQSGSGVDNQVYPGLSRLPGFSFVGS